MKIKKICSNCKHERLNGIIRFWECDGKNCSCFCMIHHYEIVIDEVKSQSFTGVSRK